MSLKTTLLTAAFMVTALPLTAQAEGQLNMICGATQPVCDVVVGAFSAKTGINVNMIRMSTGEAYARIRSEARNPKTDVWFSGTHDPHYQAADEDLTYPYKSTQYDNLIELAQKMADDTGNRSTTYGVGVLGFIYNKDLLKEKNIEPPKCWSDLLKPEYKGEIALANPNTAGTGYTVLVTLSDLMGEDGAFDYLKKLNDNVAAYNKTGSTATAQASRGEIGVAIGFLHDAMTTIKQGFPLATAVPCEGTGYTLDGLSIVKGAKNLEEAKAFVDWILTPEAQYLNIENGLNNSYPTAKGTKLSEYTVSIEGVKLLDLDQKLYGSTEKRRSLLGRWDKEIGAIAE